MKYLLPALVITAMMASCGSGNDAPNGDSANKDSLAADTPYTAGDKITEEGAIPASEMKAKLGDAQSMNMKVVGKIDECCQKKGCWTEVALNDSETVHVTFKDYKFFVPMDAAGKTIIMEGVAKYDTTSVEMLKHLASDAGKPQEEIDKITEPEFALTFEASGVIVKE